MWPFKTRRIVEVNGRFIPQRFRFLLGWVSMDKDGTFEWHTLSCQLEYCSYPTIEEARASYTNIKVHKAQL